MRKWNWIIQVLEAPHRKGNKSSSGFHFADFKNTSTDEVNSLVQFEDLNISENLKNSPMLRTLFPPECRSWNGWNGKHVFFIFYKGGSSTKKTSQYWSKWERNVRGFDSIYVDWWHLTQWHDSLVTRNEMKWYEKKSSEPNIFKGFSPELYQSLSWYGSGKHMQQYQAISGLSLRSGIAKKFKWSLYVP